MLREGILGIVAFSQSPRCGSGGGDGGVVMVFDLLKPAAEQEEREFEVSCGRFLSFSDLTRGVVGFFADVCLRPISRSEWREHTKMFCLSTKFIFHSMQV